MTRFREHADLIHDKLTSKNPFAHESSCEIHLSIFKTYTAIEHVSMCARGRVRVFASHLLSRGL